MAFQNPYGNSWSSNEDWQNANGVIGANNALTQKNKDLQSMLDQKGSGVPTIGHLGFTGFGSNSGMPWQAGQGYANAAGSVLAGTQDAAEEERKKYEAMLRSRTAGAGIGYADMMRSTGNSLHGMGVSPELTSLIQGGQKARYQSGLGSMLGGAEADYHGSLAQLFKGTGTELAGINQSQAEMLLNYLVGDKSAKNAGKTGMGDMAGMLGAVASIAAL